MAKEELVPARGAATDCTVLGRYTAIASVDRGDLAILTTTKGIDWLFGLIWLAALGAAVRGIARDKWTDLDFIAVLTCLLFYSLLALYRPARLLACIATITIVVPFYMFEVYLHMGSSKASFTQELRAQGIEAYPRVSPNELMDLWLSTGDENPIRVGGREVLPLAGIPHSATVYCQADDGGMIVYKSDRLGFRNVENASSTEPPEYALLGDSFVHGYCVQNDDTYAVQLGILGSTRNFGIDGTSVLAQLAIYTEYVQHLRAQHLIWFFYAGNDLHGFVAERERRPFRAYFTPSHSQDLMALNGSIAVATKRYIDEQLMLRAGRARLDEERPFANVIQDFLFLRKARGALLGANVRKLGQVSQDEMPPSISGTQWNEITEIWKRVIDRQRKHGGDVSLVYIPSVNRFATGDPTIHLEVERTVRGIWRELGVDHMSLTDFLLTVKDPLSLYSGIHFTKQGYRVTADFLIEQLRRAAGRSRKHARGGFEARVVADPSPDQAHEIACSSAHDDPRVRVSRRAAGGSAGPGAVGSIPSSCISPEFTSGEQSLEAQQYQRERSDRRETQSTSFLPVSTREDAHHHAHRGRRPHGGGQPAEPGSRGTPAVASPAPHQWLALR